MAEWRRKWERRGLSRVSSVWRARLEGPETGLLRALNVQRVALASVPHNSLDSWLPLIRTAKLPNVERLIPSAGEHQALTASKVPDFSAPCGHGLHEHEVSPVLVRTCLYHLRGTPSPSIIIIAHRHLENFSGSEGN